ncbi:RsmE family RNA methyltransferase [uncultured Peptoniphilus sp.]|uniref:RsmE family RNA methyltransferase n=1 Tax=uncultured Peptoniphilus sp. TaxID=254354 RepID=UPI0028062C57|nr:RsmE family RNA methyltransferase [uncultured Peptoniphilus sp.]
MYRFFENRNYDNKNDLSKENYHHLKNVIRIEEDEDFEVIFKDKNLIFNLLEDKLILKGEGQKNRESDINLSLFFGILKGDKNEKIIERGTEVGVKDFYPLVMERCISNISAKEDKKILRWQKISEAAAKQAKRDIIPLVHKPIKPVELIENFKGDLILLYEGEEEIFFKDIKSKLSKNLGLVVGPEGGISPKELEIFKDAYKISLGRRILRAETAAIAGSFYIIHNLECD